jgi:hypothetical protein
VKNTFWWLPDSNVNFEIAVKLVIRQRNANQSRWEKKEVRLFVTIIRIWCMWVPSVLSWWKRSRSKRMDMLPRKCCSGYRVGYCFQLSQKKRSTMIFRSELAPSLQWKWGSHEKKTISKEITVGNGNVMIAKKGLQVTIVRIRIWSFFRNHG